MSTVGDIYCRGETKESRAKNQESRAKTGVFVDFGFCENAIFNT